MSASPSTSTLLRTMARAVLLAAGCLWCLVGTVWGYYLPLPARTVKPAAPPPVRPAAPVRPAPVAPARPAPVAPARPAPVPPARPAPAAAPTRIGAPAAPVVVPMAPPRPAPSAARPAASPKRRSTSPTGAKRP